MSKRTESSCGKWFAIWVVVAVFLVGLGFGGLAMFAAFTTESGPGVEQEQAP